ncbi:MAG TPA: cytochrome P450 [Pseudonocardia sp.]|nr:cytochrome P450 [Pseudonocardia sp.]
MTAAERDYPALLSTYDLFDPEQDAWKYDAFAYAREKCPIVHTSGGAEGGFWLITRYEDMRRIVEDTETFSSVQGSPAPSPSLGPLTSDPPLHTGLRKLLNPLFSRTYSLKFEDEIRSTCRSLIEEFIDDGEVEILSQFSGPLVSRIIARMVFDEPDEEKMKKAIQIVDAVTESGTEEAFMQLAGLAMEYYAKAQEAPPEQDGVLRRLVTGDIDGEPVPADAALGTLMVLFLGGLDTTKSAIGHIVYQIGLDSALEDRVRNPKWVRHDMDEFIRLQSPVATFARNILKDVEINGVQMKAGERVLIRFDSANRDDEQFPGGDQLQFDPPRGGNAGFGLGIHRCIGAHMGRVQIGIAFEELLARITNIRLACDPSDIHWKPGIANCPDRIPITFDKL